MYEADTNIEKCFANCGNFKYNKVLTSKIDDGVEGKLLDLGLLWTRLASDRLGSDEPDFLALIFSFLFVPLFILRFKNRLALEGDGGVNSSTVSFLSVGSSPKS